MSGETPPSPLPRPFRSGGAVGNADGASGKMVGMTLRPVWHWRAVAARFVIALSVFTIATASSFGYSYWYANKKTDEIPRVRIRDALIPKVKPTDPANYLIVGSDSRAFVKDAVAEEKFGDPKKYPENLADVIMIAHVDPNAPGKGFLVSIPRDTWVGVPGHGQQKINAAFNFGDGPELLIDTIEQNFKFKINHYLKLDFVAFAEVVNAIGRVHIFFPYPARDTYTGLDVPTSGCVALTGLEALAYARSRHYLQKTASGYHEDQTQDIGRIQRQQYFIRSLAQEAIKAGGRDPRKAKSMLDRIVPHLVADRNLHLPDLLRLLRAFRSVDPGAVQMVTVPTKRLKVNSTTEAQLVIPEQAQPIFALLGSFTRPVKASTDAKVKPAQVRVLVLNGSNVKGIASSTATSLRAAGFASGGTPTDADHNDYPYTLIRYTEGNEAKAKLVQSYLHNVGLLTKSATPLGGADVVIVTGVQDFAGVAAPGSHPTTSVGVTTTTAPTHDTTPGVPAATGGRPAVGCP
jgi:LCP family protein required for cell wall assembly